MMFKCRLSPSIFWILLFLLSSIIGCTAQNDYPFMVIGFPINQEGIDIVTASGTLIDKLTLPWIFTLKQAQKALLPLTYPLTRHSPWKEAVFVSAEQITFCPHPTQDQWQDFNIHSAQIGTLEGARYKTEQGKVIFSIAIDAGPLFEFVYRCEQDSIEVISRRKLFGW